MNDIHLWNLDQRKIFVTLAQDTVKHLFERCKNVCGNANRTYSALFEAAKRQNIQIRQSNGNMHEAIVNQTRAIPLWTLIEMTKIASASSDNDNAAMKAIEREVQEIKVSGRGARIRMRFPIQITPEFTAIMAHFLGDGTLGVKYTTASYCQKNELGRAQFVGKLNSVFGTFKVNKKAYKNFHVMVPKSIADIIREHYQAERAGTLTKRLPPKIHQEPTENRLAALTAFLVDEGSIGDSIEISLANQKLLEDIRQIATGLGCQCSKIGERTGHNSENPLYRFRISLREAKRLLKDIRTLSITHPLCNLANKQPILEFIVQRQCRQLRKSSHGETKEKIKELRAKGIKKVCQIKEHLNLSGSTISEHLRAMKKAGTIDS